MGVVSYVRVCACVCVCVCVCVLRMMGHKTSLIGPCALVSTLSSAGPRLLWPATPLSRTTAHWCFMSVAATYKTAERVQGKVGWGVVVGWVRGEAKI